MKEIKVLLLQGGLEIIAEIEPVRGIALSNGEGPLSGYRLNKPFRILPVPIPMQTPQGIQLNIQPSLIPLMACTIQSWIEIDLGDIIGEPMEPNKQFESQYVQRTTGLQLAG
jgi:hypothetical protein